MYVSKPVFHSNLAVLLRIVLFCIIMQPVVVIFYLCFRTNCQSYPQDLRTVLFWVIMQWVVVIFYRRFGAALHYIMIRCPKTLVKNYHYSLHNNPEEQSSHLLHGRSLKSRIAILLLHLYVILSLIHVRSISFSCCSL